MVIKIYDIKLMNCLFKILYRLWDIYVLLRVKYLLCYIVNLYVKINDGYILKIIMLLWIYKSIINYIYENIFKFFIILI